MGERKKDIEHDGHQSSCCGHSPLQVSARLPRLSPGPHLWLTPPLPLIRALVTLDLSNNDLRAVGGEVLASAFEDNPVMQELNIAANNFGRNATTFHPDMTGVIAIINAIASMQALTKLDVSKNALF